LKNLFHSTRNNFSFLLGKSYSYENSYFKKNGVQPVK